jgi:hypothetical protein
MLSILNIAPKYCKEVEHLRTVFVEWFANAQTATKVIGIEQNEKDMAQRFTGIVDLRLNASCTGIATGASDITVMV